jgi:hypothetical protein
MNAFVKWASSVLKRPDDVIVTITAVVSTSAVALVAKQAKKTEYSIYGLLHEYSTV